jgi:hypothetical protein
MLFKLIRIVFSWMKWTQSKWFIVMLFLFTLSLILWIYASIHPFAIFSDLSPVPVSSDPGPWS